MLYLLLLAVYPVINAVGIDSSLGETGLNTGPIWNLFSSINSVKDTHLNNLMESVKKGNVPYIKLSKQEIEDLKKYKPKDNVFKNTKGFRGHEGMDESTKTYNKVDEETENLYQQYKNNVHALHKPDKESIVHIGNKVYHIKKNGNVFKYRVKGSKIVNPFQSVFKNTKFKGIPKENKRQ